MAMPMGRATTSGRFEIRRYENTADPCRLDQRRAIHQRFSMTRPGSSRHSRTGMSSPTSISTSWARLGLRLLDRLVAIITKSMVVSSRRPRLVAVGGGPSGKGSRDAVHRRFLVAFAPHQSHGRFPVKIDMILRASPKFGSINCTEDARTGSANLIERTLQRGWRAWCSENAGAPTRSTSFWTMPRIPSCRMLLGDGEPNCKRLA